jgi:DNA primase
MPGLIPENILEDILSKIDISELIGSYLPLKRAGKNFKACCPFHHEKTASFMVSPDRQIYHCFGCGESGNAFKFLMRYERMDFPEAVETLAKKTGVILPENENNLRQPQGQNTGLFKLNELAADFYANCLKLPEASAAKEYLKNRSIKPETINELKIGFTLNKWDSLINYLRSKSVNIGLMEKVGLVITKEGGGYYDRFRNRIIFPIFDVRGRVLGFGARVLDNSLPKYINSPETAIYTKGKHLYGLNFAKDSIRESDFSVIVEGYLDFLIPYQKGIKNIVASLGTALTTEQARLLKRYSNNVVMVYDADSAGELATLRSLDIFIEEEMEVRIVSLPKGFDPDLFVLKNGADSFKELINSAKNIFDYKLGILKARFNDKQSESKAKIASLMLETIIKIKNAVLKSEYVRKLAQELNIKEEAILEEIGKIKPQKSNAVKVPSLAKEYLAVNATEKLLMSLMLEENTLISRIKENLDPKDFQDERIAKIVSIMFNLVEEGKEVRPQILMNHLGEEISGLICESAFLPEDLGSEHREKVVEDCIQRMKAKSDKLKRERLHEQIKAAQHSGNQDYLNELLEEFHSLITKKADKA